MQTFRLQNFKQMNNQDKTVLEHRKDIIENLKYFSISEKKWLIRRFWKGIEDKT